MAERSIGEAARLGCRSLSSSLCRPSSREGVTRRALVDGAAAALVAQAWWQERFPSRPIRMILPYPHEFAARLREDIEALGSIVRAARITATD